MEIYPSMWSLCMQIDCLKIEGIYEVNSATEMKK